MADHPFDHIRGDMLRIGDGAKWQNLQARRAEQQVHQRNEANSSDQRARKIPLRIFHFRANEIQILPTVIRPQRRGQSRQKRGEQTSAGRTRPDRIRRMRARWSATETRRQ